MGSADLLGLEGLLKHKTLHNQIDVNVYRYQNHTLLITALMLKPRFQYMLLMNSRTYHLYQVPSWISVQISVVLHGSARISSPNTSLLAPSSPYQGYDQHDQLTLTSNTARTSSLYIFPSF